MKKKYKYYFRYTYLGQDWTEVSKDKYDKAMSLKPLWNVMNFEAKKRSNNGVKKFKFI